MMKRFLLKGLSALLLVSLLLTALSGFALAEKVVGADGKSYIRNSPSLSGKILGTLPKGASATYLDDTQTDNRGVAWYYISYNGTRGWVSSMYTSLGDDDSYNSNHGNVWATGGKSYIRNQPSLSGRVLGTFPKGERANYLGQTATDNRGVDWYKITYGTITGWVSSMYTSRSRSGGGSSGGGSSSSGRVVVGTGGKSYIRDDSNRSGKILGTLPKGATATYLGTTRADERDVDWYYISYNGTKGWVSSMYTTLRNR